MKKEHVCVHSTINEESTRTIQNNNLTNEYPNKRINNPELIILLKTKLQSTIITFNNFIYKQQSVFSYKRYFLSKNSKNMIFCKLVKKISRIPSSPPPKKFLRQPPFPHNVLRLQDQVNYRPITLILITRYVSPIQLLTNAFIQKLTRILAKKNSNIGFTKVFAPTNFLNLKHITIHQKRVAQKNSACKQIAVLRYIQLQVSYSV
eukprot:TRINITY_DN18705_c1_g1_i1.p2 TRINITY_DN18705_c1_g1~~TRINITY_DN18705_c1_g1_i1.p2  ORF type:complete len:205 (-),score=-7.81 TRINITY_DN18705_c1_g1_i1:189-803(-)